MTNLVYDEVLKIILSEGNTNNQYSLVIVKDETMKEISYKTHNELSAILTGTNKKAKTARELMINTKNYGCGVYYENELYITWVDFAPIGIIMYDIGDNVFIHKPKKQKNELHIITYEESLNITGIIVVLKKLSELTNEKDKNLYTFFNSHMELF